MFALEFLNFQYSVLEHSSKMTPFYKSVYGDVSATNGVGVGVSSGVVPGDLYGGLSLTYSPFFFSIKSYVSGEIPITEVSDPFSEPSEENPPYVVDRVRFRASQFSAGARKDLGKNLKASLSLKFIYASAGKYGWGAGGGADLSFLYSPFGFAGIYMKVENVLTSPVVWNTGRKEFARPLFDTRLLIRPFGKLALSTGATFSPDGRGFNIWRDGFLSLYGEFWKVALFGGWVEGMPRGGISYRHRSAVISLGASYHFDFGYSFKGDVVLKLWD